MNPYYAQHEQFTKMLGNLSRILDKAEAHAEARKFSPDNYLNLRLAPDMFTFTRQVQIACDIGKFYAARMSGKDAPKHPDDETTFAQLKSRIESTLGFLNGFSPDDFAGVADVKVMLPRAEGKYMTGPDAAVQFSAPNFYFHVAMCYGLLRGAGVELGKGDFLGALPFRDA